MVSGALLAGAALTSPFWAWGRPDRAWGFALGAAASLVRFAWSVRLARRLGEGGPRQYAAMRVTSLAVLGAALAVAGAVEGVDLAAAAVGIFVATVATVIAALLETSPARGSRDSSDGTAEGGRLGQPS